MLVLFPIEADATTVPLGQALREGITEVGRQPRAGDARNLGVFEFFARHPTQTLGE